MDIRHDVLSLNVASSLQNRVRHFCTRIALNNGSAAIEAGYLADVLASFHRKVQDLYDEYIGNTALPGDRAQIILTTDEMHSPISTKLTSASDLTADHLMTTLQKSQNSGLSIRFSDNIVLEFVHLKTDPGWEDKMVGGARRPDLLFYKRFSVKKSVLNIPMLGKNDRTCMVRALVVGHAHAEMIHARTTCAANDSWIGETYKNYRALIDKRCNKAMKKQVSLYYEQAGIPYGTACGIDELQKFQPFLHGPVKIVSAEDHFKVTYSGPKVSNREHIYLLFSRESPNDEIGHYDLITNIRGFYGERFYCVHCDTKYHNIADHTCDFTSDWWCKACRSPACKQTPTPDKCPRCGQQVQSAECLKRHTRAKCGNQWQCSCCRAVRKRGKIITDPVTRDFRYKSDDEMVAEHDCAGYFCRSCEKEVPSTHRCFVKPKILKPMQQKYLFFDMETDQSTSKHVVNYIHMAYYEPTEEEEEAAERAQWPDEAETAAAAVEEEDEEEEEENHAPCSILARKRKKPPKKNKRKNKRRRRRRDDANKPDPAVADHTQWKGRWVEKSFPGYECLDAFMKEVVQEDFRGYTCVAHNLKGFDGIFILRSCLKEGGFKPQIIRKGHKLQHLLVPKLGIRFVDSFNFLPTGLKKLPGAFGLDCGRKGDFPHFFNRPENQDYVGPYPPPAAYGYQYMSTADQTEFLRWHNEQEGKTFVFRDEMAVYCAQDVKILKEACMAYRTAMCVETGCDPLQYTTMAAVCSAVYMAKFMPKDMIARVPPTGYPSARYSSEALEYLEHLIRHEGLSIRHAGNGGEVKVGAYTVDGYDESTRTVYEYYGCFHHGCPKCYKSDTRDPDTGSTAHCSYVRTCIREKALRSAGFTVVTKWACDWKEEKAKDPALAARVKAMNVPTPLNPRDAFFGGRTETFKLYLISIVSKYYDIRSLYPSIMLQMLYPVGHPEIITYGFKDISCYFGFIKCTVLPPDYLYLPVLPMHSGPTKKLLFPLCRTCAEDFQTAECTHVDEERSLTGTWFSEEVKLALEKGYKMLTIHSVWHFVKTTKDLFAKYMRTFYKKKLLSSGVPVAGEAEFQQFVREVQEKDGITISSISEFSDNPAMRQIVKLMLNNLWGRFGMQENLSKTVFVDRFQELLDMFDNDALEVQNVLPITEKVTQVTYRLASLDFLPTTEDTNIFIAVTTTAWARIRLYRELEKVGERAVYCDTDSVIFQESPNPSENISLGSFLGDMSDELGAGDSIVEFVSGGPKNYAYKTALGKCVSKVKGFSLNATNKRVFSFDELKEIVVNGVNVPEGESRHVPMSSSQRKLFTNAQKEAFKLKHSEDSDSPSAYASKDGISVFNPTRITRTRDWEVIQAKEQKLFTFNFNKRIILENYDTLPYGCREEDSIYL